MMKATSPTPLIAGATFLAGMSLMVLVMDSKGQGPLEPPGPPEPSMVTLQQLSDQLAEFEEYRESSGQNVLAIRSNNADVLTPISSGWISQSLTGQPDFIVESDGSFLVIVGSQAYGFSTISSTWSNTNVGSTITRVASSKGGLLAFATATRAYGYRPQTGAFVTNGPTGTINELVGSD